MLGPRSLYSTLNLLLAPIHGPLYTVTDDIVHPVGGDEEDPVCVLWSQRYLKGLILSQLVRDLRESILRFVQAFVDSIYYASKGGWLVNARSSTGGLLATCSGALHRLFLMCLLAGINQPYHHTVGHALILLCCAFCMIVTIARIDPLP